MSRLVWCVAFVAVFSVLFPTQAEAQRGFLFVTYGVDAEILVSDLLLASGLPEDEILRAVPRARLGRNLGLVFRYNYFGLFWMNLWTWGGKFYVCSPSRCVSTESQDPAEIAGDFGLDVGYVSKPWFYSYPPLLMLFLTILVLMAVFTLFVGAPPETNGSESKGGTDESSVDVEGAFPISRSSV